MQLDSVPHTYILPLADAKAPRPRLSAAQEADPKAFLDSLPGALQALRESTGVQVKVLHDPALLVVGVFLLTMLLALLSALVSRDLPSTLLLYQSPSLWTVVSLVFVCICTHVIYTS
ncbi:hypothetical protein EON64_14905 [archaeon]|nr:MAG: hypothetical protein EON64_14905 [archaeon]